jgi:ketosteroid isomerase-like protein
MQVDEARLKAIDEMLAREDIRQCLVRYTRGVDRHDTSLVATAYHADALDDHTDYIGIGTGIGSYANASHDAIWEAHQHFMTNTTIELDGDTAHVECYFIVAGRRKQNSGTDIHGGRYVDRFEKRDGRWAIAARVVVYEWCSRAEDAVAQLETFVTGTQDKSDTSYLRPLKVFRELTASVGS